MFALVKIDPSKLAWIALSPDAKDMAENLYRALWSLLICMIVTVVVSLMTKPKPAEELKGLVWAATKQPSESGLPLYQRPIFWAVGVRRRLRHPPVDFLVGGRHSDLMSVVPESAGRERNGN